MTTETLSPPAGPLPGNCEAPVAGLSYRQWVREAVRALHQRLGTVRLLAVGLLVSGLLTGAALQLGGGAYIMLKAELAQILIARAWAHNLDQGAALQRPWPWADMRPLARLDFPRLHETRYVLDDDSGRTLAFGPGHRPGSALPATGGNTVISGHRDTHFALLRDVRKGDRIRVQTVDGRDALYLVNQLQIVDEHEIWVAADHGDDELTLITCWPFDALTPQGPERLVISASRLKPSVRGFWH